MPPPTETEWRGPPDLEGSLYLMSDLVLLPGNPRRGDVDAVARSLTRFGQRKPIVVNDDGVIIAGNHTFQAALQCGWSHIAVIDASDLDGAEQRAYALADNRLSDLAEYDDGLLLEALLEHDDLSGLGYSNADLDELRARVNEPINMSPSGDERFTPRWLFEAMAIEFTVDLAAPEGGVSWIPAGRWYTKQDDALLHDWSGETAWCNPPFSFGGDFGRKWCSEVEEGVWLGPMSHNTKYVFQLINGASAVWIPSSIEFVMESGSTQTVSYPVFLAGWGECGLKALRNLGEVSSDRGALLVPIS